jgi:hypothetical protein
VRNACYGTVSLHMFGEMSHDLHHRVSDMFGSEGIIEILASDEVGQNDVNAWVRKDGNATLKGSTGRGEKGIRKGGIFSLPLVLEVSIPSVIVDMIRVRQKQFIWSIMLDDARYISDTAVLHSHRGGQISMRKLYGRKKAAVNSRT